MANEKTPVAATPAAPMTVAEELDSFAEAFAEATQPEAPAAAATPAAASADQGGVTPPPVAGDAPPAAGAAESEAGTTTPPADAAAAAVDEGEGETPEAKITRLEAELAAAKKPAAAEPKPAATPPAAAAPAKDETPSADATPAEAKEPEWYKLKPEEEAALTAYEKEWPDISQAEAIRTKKAVYDAVQYMFSYLAKNYNPVLQRFNQMSDTIAEQLTLGALRGEHEDYDEVLEKVEQWVDTLPVAFKRGAQQVLKEGTPEEVSELITTYKEQNKSAAAAAGAADAGGTPPAAVRTTEVSAIAKQAAKKLAVVGSQRTAPPTAADPNDFEAAWKDAVAG